MIREPTNKYAFVEFSSSEEAKVAIELSGTEILGKHLKISLSRSPISNPTPVQSNPTQISPTDDNATKYQFLSESELKRKAEEDDKIKRTIYVTSIDTQILEAQVCEFFSYCGRIVNYRVCGDTQHPTRFAFFEFEQKESAQAAVSLSGQFLGRYALRILGSRTPIQPTPGAVGNGAVYSFTPAHHDQINRTVYVGNADISLTEDDLKEFFDANCGPVTKVVLAGDAVHSARFAFVEFLHMESRNKALECSGTLLGNRNIRINPSRTPILGGGKAYASTAPSINPATGTGQYAVNHLAQSSKFPPVAQITDPYYSQPQYSSKTKSTKKKEPTSTLGAHHKPFTDMTENDKKRRKNDWSSSDEDSDHEHSEERRQRKLMKHDPIVPGINPSTTNLIPTTHDTLHHPHQHVDNEQNHENGDYSDH
ncbi:predicted protein [Naegleria gruberi]|uniref:Predicted protein n=1 Tax=Naegleria gruberi TaxID=5762 RepID=D2VK88_NAEGR|nr:uncharacterized protein NAEGRDRAFT_69308 [Naegleria gruberi]EFC42906.1 predicted protein [Naegleria gruberi]|eukprot:XP_002675650.1 predicted protein [Naegleria gruberi strain NEG-M]